MDLIAKVNHPILTTFFTDIRYIDRAETLRKQVQIQRTQVPYVALDPRTDKPFLRDDGSEVIAWRASLTDTFAADEIASYVTGWSGLVLDGVEIPFSKDNLIMLLDPRLDVQLDREIAGKKQKLTVSWSRALAEKAYERKTFDPDPFVSGSAKP